MAKSESTTNQQTQDPPLPRTAIELGPEVPETLILRLENARLQLESASKALFRSHEDAIRTLKNYTLVLQVVFGVILGGSIYSLWSVDKYIDSRVAKRVVKTDRMALALSQAQVGRWRDALSIMDEVRSEIATNKLDADGDFKKFVYINLLWVLSQVDEVDPSGNWVGQSHYNQLVKDEDFQREILTRGIWKEDGEVASTMALCILKYEPPLGSTSKARGYLEVSLNSIYPLQRKAYIHWQLAMLDLLENQIVHAREHLTAAQAINPLEYRWEDLKTYKNTFLNSADFTLWSRTAERLKKPPFIVTYEQFLASL